MVSAPEFEFCAAVSPELEEAGFWEVFNSPLFEVEEVKG